MQVEELKKWWMIFGVLEIGALFLKAQNIKRIFHFYRQNQLNEKVL